MALKDILKVMIVDDMSVSRGLMTQGLEEIGIKNIDFQKSGQDALNRLAVNPAHLVISDYNMPGMSGLDLLENLRSNKQTQQIGFILITGSPSQDLLERGVKLGLNNLIKKPFTTQSLKASIEAVVGKI
ncbi:response regulator [Pararhodobacter zhoushanensis]|uniref:Response regulator n=1 Tax=Pararhodobacter zhoushanensis TaxID=2479545 RepID=A0ABT3GWV3_9RHOB|nr:response regulator [Pararhodobacter zhoushanensis]MCW1932024.1 response regulator [Pararhodobacter zhoushanensis]